MIEQISLPQIAMEIHIPQEIIEEILLNLPAKSLGRFSAVSKSWRAVISDEEFIRQHKIRGSLPGRERIIFSHCPSSLMPASTLRLSSLSSNQFDQPFISPLHNVKILASCSDMWCVARRSSLYVLSPSMGTYRKLRPPLSTDYIFYYGMGFDSLSGDYKILKVSKQYYPHRAELYSLRSNSWRMIAQPFPIQCSPGVAVSNSLHFITKSLHNNGTTSIVSFDLSTEKYADNFAQPPFDEPGPKHPDDKVGLTVLRGNLCLYLNYAKRNYAKRFVLWEMQEYGDGNSWTKIMDTDVSLITSSMRLWPWKTKMEPLYLDQNGWILMKVTNSKSGTSNIFEVYEDEWQIIWKACGCTTGLFYTESLAGNILQ